MHRARIDDHDAAGDTRNPLTNAPYRQLARRGNMNRDWVRSASRYPFPKMLLSSNFLFPLTEGGLRDKLTIAIGVDRVLNQFPVASFQFPAVVPG